MATDAILSYFFEEQWTKNHPQYPSRLSRALFPTTFLDIHSSLENYTRFQTKISKMYTSFQTEKAQKHVLLAYTSKKAFHTDEKILAQGHR